MITIFDPKVGSFKPTPPLRLGQQTALLLVKTYM